METAWCTIGGLPAHSPHANGCTGDVKVGRGGTRMELWVVQTPQEMARLASV